MRNTTVRRLALMMTCVFTLSSCGGGGGSGDPDPITRRGLTFGTVTALGSVSVNGATYQTTSQTDVTVDGAAGSVGSILPGQVVTIEWSSTDAGLSRTADAVVAASAVAGSIDGFNLADGTFQVIGQDVVADDSTAFIEDPHDPGPRNLSEMQTYGYSIEVSGLLDANGIIRATRIERAPEAIFFRLRGPVQATADCAIIVNGITVNYLLTDDMSPCWARNATPTTFSGFDDGAADPGELVMARGTTIVLGEVRALRVELASPSPPIGEDGMDGDIEGFVSGASASGFTVSGIQVDATNALIEGGGIATNAHVEVEGLFNAAGTLIADRVEVKAAP